MCQNPECKKVNLCLLVQNQGMLDRGSYANGRAMRILSGHSPLLGITRENCQTYIWLVVWSDDEMIIVENVEK